MKKSDYIAIHNVTKTYGDIPVVDDVSFVIPKGSIVALIGPNGAGKSTLAKMIMGLIKPDKGTITINGKTPESARTSIGYVPQRFTYNPHIPITVEEFLLLSLYVIGKQDQKQLKIIQKKFSDVGLPKETMKKQLGELSGGQLQRVLIARSLLMKKELLIMDEPVAGLDIEGRKSIHELLKELNQKNGTTVILISHELDTVFRYADNVLCIDKRMLCQGKPKEALTEEILNEMYGERHQAHYHHQCIH